MSEFKCEVVKIEDVIRHPNADTLTICKIRGFNCITSDIEPGKQRYYPGSYVVYIPEAAVLPDYILKKMGFWDETNNKGTLSGSSGNRVKIIKLRGEYSQGIMLPVDVLPYNPDLCIHNDKEQTLFVAEGDDVSEFLNIHKYEPAIPAAMAGKVGRMFGHTQAYDIENIQNYPGVFGDGEEVVVTEKLHGTLCQLSFIKNPPEEAKPYLVNIEDKLWAFATSKGLAKGGLIQQNTEENKDNVYVKALIDFISNGTRVFHIMEMFRTEENLAQIFIFGEIFGPGIQSGFTYNKQKPTFKVFDIFVKDVEGKSTPLPDGLLENFCKAFALERVPVLYRGPFTMGKMIELRDGKTVEGQDKHIREGVVIRPVLEQEVRGLPCNRKQLKFVSPAYKMKEDDNAIQ